MFRDGTIRLIYDGSTCHANGISTTNNIAILNQTYNAVDSRSEYVGWTYTENAQRGINSSSNAKTQIDSWYNDNLKKYENKIVEGKYCNDRNTASDSTWSSIPTKIFYYASYERLNTNKTPTLSCSNEDIYTLKAGLITADETAYAGGVYGLENSNYYLYNNQTYWTMSPYYTSNSPRANNFLVHSSGRLSANALNVLRGIRPVINISSDIMFNNNSDGTLDNPYIVKGI